MAAANKFNELGPITKMERGNVHFAELQRAIIAYHKSQPHRVVFEADPDGLRKHARLKVDAQIPETVAAILGDAVHNMRSALDLLACVLAARNGHTSGTAMRETYFPITASKELFERGTYSAKTASWISPATDKMKRLSSKHRDFITALSPYKGGGDDFYHLHQMDVLDKHQLLTPIAARLALQDGPLGLNPLEERLFIWGPTRRYLEVRDDMIISTATISEPDSALLVEGGTEIAFGQGDLAGQPVLPALFKIGNTVYKAITDLLAL